MEVERGEKGECSRKYQGIQSGGFNNRRRVCNSKCCKVKTSRRTHLLLLELAVPYFNLTILDLLTFLWSAN